MVTGRRAGRCVNLAAERLLSVLGAAAGRLSASSRCGRCHYCLVLFLDARSLVQRRVGRDVLRRCRCVIEALELESLVLRQRRPRFRMGHQRIVRELGDCLNVLKVRASGMLTRCNGCFSSVLIRTLGGSRGVREGLLASLVNLLVVSCALLLLGGSVLSLLVLDVNRPLALKRLWLWVLQRQWRLLVGRLFAWRWVIGRLINLVVRRRLQVFGRDLADEVVAQKHARVPL